MNFKLCSLLLHLKNQQWYRVEMLSRQGFENAYIRKMLPISEIWILHKLAACLKVTSITNKVIAESFR